MKFLLNDGNEHLGEHGAPNLRLDCVLAVAQKLLDAQVLLDPFEEQLDLPAAFVQSGNGQAARPCCWSGRPKLAWLLGPEPDTAQVFGVVLRNVVTVQCDGLIADKTAAPVHLGRVNALGSKTTMSTH